MNEGIWIVDAFTDVAFRGNAAAVCLLKDGFPEDDAMQLLAAQMNLSETVFVVPNGPKSYKLRWFTPEVEVPLCGHATIAATHVLHQSGALQKYDTATYTTLSGPITASIHDAGIRIDLPLQAGKPAKPIKALEALGVDMIAFARNESEYLVEVKDLDTLKECTPNFRRLAKTKTHGVIVTTATNTGKYDYACRYFAPAIGINEDMATGSIHCFLAPYWAEKLGKQNFHVLQASKGHGIMDIDIRGDRVLITGKAVTTLKGDITPLQQQGNIAC